MILNIMMKRNMDHFFIFFKKTIKHYEHNIVKKILNLNVMVCWNQFIFAILNYLDNDIILIIFVIFIHKTYFIC